MSWITGGIAAGSVAAGALGCGGSEAGQDATFKTVIASERILGSLSSSEQALLCEELDGYASSLRASLGGDACKVSGLLEADVVAGGESAASDADLRAACTTAYDACTAALGTGDGGVAPPACDLSRLDATNCGATVSDLIACIDDAEARFRALYGGLPGCGEVTRADVDAALTLDCRTLPPSCAALQAKCPSLVTTATSLAAAH
jgi:hypothetical protein